MKITVSGIGYVGLTLGVCLAEKGYEITCVDTNEEKVKLIEKGISPIYEENLEKLLQKNCKEGRLNVTTDYEGAYQNAEIIFIAVATPAQKNGSTNLNHVKTVAKQIAKNIKKDCLIIIKSTVPIGTSRKIEQLIKESLTHNVKVEVASNPEFLSQGNAIKDILYAKRIVIGTNSKQAEKTLKQIYQVFDVPIVSVSRESAEMIKYASNDFLALKISYINEIANLCELMGADIEEVVQGMSYDTRIGCDFLQAGIGYGGSCFPKDTKALKYLAKQYGYRLKTVEATIDVNTEQRTKLLKMALKTRKSLKGQKIAILGLTFKAGTDDLREAPAEENIKLLLENEADNLYVYDPVGIEKFQKKYPTEVHYVKNPEDALKDAELCFVFTEWNQIKKIKPFQFKRLMKTAVIYDGRNIYSLKDMKKYKIEYYSIGRKISTL